MKRGSRMKKRPQGLAEWIAVYAVLGSCVALAIGISGYTHPKNVSLVLFHNVRELGRTSIREECRVSFPIHNAGRRRLVLNELDQECGCGDQTLNTILVAPGETVEVYVPLDTRFSTGLVENHASFTSNDPAHPRFDLTARAFVAAGKPVLTDRDDLKQASVLIWP